MATAKRGAQPDDNDSTQTSTVVQDPTASTGSDFNVDPLKSDFDETVEGGIYQLANGKRVNSRGIILDAEGNPLNPSDEQGFSHGLY